MLPAAAGDSDADERRGRPMWIFNNGVDDSQGMVFNPEFDQVEFDVNFIMRGALDFDNKDDAFKRGKDWVFYDEVLHAILTAYQSDVDALLDGDDPDSVLGDDDDEDSGGPDAEARRFKKILATMQDRVVFYMNMFFCKVTGEGKETYILQDFWEFGSIGEANRIREEAYSAGPGLGPAAAKEVEKTTFINRRTLRYRNVLLLPFLSKRSAHPPSACLVVAAMRDAAARPA
jgi:hypothetical protein